MRNTFPAPNIAAATEVELRSGLRLPNLLVIGAMKASTTTFYELLSRHPQVWFPDEKEPHYFTSARYGEEQAFRDYAALFTAAPAGAVVGEASTGYTKLPHLGPTPGRIRETLGEPKLIYLLRDPVERVVSNFRHSWCAERMTPPSLAETVKSDPILLDASRYHSQLRAYWDEFGADAVLIITTDELHSDPSRAMQQVEAYLEIPPFSAWPLDLPASNSGQDVTRTITARRFAPSATAWAHRSLPQAGRKFLKRLIPARGRHYEVTPEDIHTVQREIEPDLAELVNVLGERIGHWPSVRRMASNHV